MVARTPPKQRKMVAAAVAPLLNPHLIRETVKKVDKCMARLQELQYTVTGGSKVISGVSLSPRSTRGYLRASLRCKQESIRNKNAASSKSPIGKFPPSRGGDWRRMSLPAMLVGETVGEILQASQFAREIVAAVADKKSNKIITEDPKTPITQNRNQFARPQLEDTTELRAKRKKETQAKLQSIRSEYSHSPTLRRARSRIQFKVSSPTNSKKEFENVKENNTRYLANRVSPRNRPWAKKTVLFPNPLFLSTPSKQQQQKFCKTRSPVIAKNKQTPHKFLIKSPVKIKSPSVAISVSPKRQSNFSKKSPKLATASKMRTSFLPSRLANRLASPSKLRRSFSPSRLAKRLVSPLKSRNTVQKSDEFIISGLKQRPFSIPMQFSNGRI